MDFDFNFISAGSGFLVGGGVGYLLARAKTVTVEETNAVLVTTLNNLRALFIKERNLNEGLTQELAAQAKLVK